VYKQTTHVNAWAFVFLPSFEYLLDTPNKEVGTRTLCVFN